MMNGLNVALLTVALLTGLPVLLGIWLGQIRGGSRTLIWLGKVAIAWGSGIALAVHGLRAGWYWPAGLVTSILAGLFTATILRALLTRRKRRSAAQIRLGLLQRTSGALLGGAIGFVMAVVGWQVALLAGSLMTPAPPSKTTRVVANVDGQGNAEFDIKNDIKNDIEAQSPTEPTIPRRSAWVRLAGIAHQGFVKHLPFAGPVTDEMLAAATIIKTPADVRREFAKDKHWDLLAALPSFEAIANDKALFADIDAAVAGNPAALYRLQKHPLIIDFFQEEQLQAIIADLKASQVAEELKQFQAKIAKREPGMQ